MGVIAPVNGERIPLPESVVQATGWEGLQADSPGELRDLGTVLQELAAESCGHSWRTLLADAPSREPEALSSFLLDRLEGERDTTLFTYTASTPEGRIPVAVAAISPRVALDFPHDGFPVLARCFLRVLARGG